MSLSNLLKSFMVLIILGGGFAASVQAQYRFNEYASLTNSNGFKLFVLEWGMKPQYDGKVAWRITNNTTSTIYEVTIADQEYTLKNGKVKRCSGQYMKSTLAPGESITIYNYVNSDENTGTWSDKNDNPVQYVALRTPNIRFKVNKHDSQRTSWAEHGKVSR